ncbi:alpha/beta hydrolase [Streptomyces sp. NPDC001443]
MTHYSDYFTPEGLRVRGTVVVVPGRGETPATYARFGKRLAADAYHVRVIEAPDLSGADHAAPLAELAARLEEAVEDTATGSGAVRPVVVVAADSGAAAVAALLGSARTPATRRPDALILAGLPGRGARSEGGWEDELDIRTSCPTHRGTLADDPQVRRGSLTQALPDALTAAVRSVDTDLPVLLLVGDADPLADHEALQHAAKILPRARLSVVHGAHHDVLNDLQHRSVAAEVVSFLETLRNDLQPLITVHSSAW